MLETRSASLPSSGTTTGETLGGLVEQIVPLLERSLPGFDDTNATRQPPSLPNHLVWVLGHLALYNHRAAERVTYSTIPLDWDPEPFAHNSTPTDDAAAYPPLQTMLERWRRSIATLAAAARGLNDEQLKGDVQWGSVTLSAAGLIGRMIFHNGVHTGQVLDQRRALQMPRQF